MEYFVKELNQKLSSRKLPITEFLAQYLFYIGYMELEEFKKCVNDVTYIPHLSLVVIPENDIFEAKAERARIIEEKDNLMEINIDFFA